MVRLNFKREGRWLTVAEGLEIYVEPVTSGVMASVMFDPAVIASGADPGERLAATTMAVARRVITEWRGVVDDEGDPVAVTPEGIDALMDVWLVFQAFRTEVMHPVFALEAEKNA
jgi:hypothetical protein